MTMASKRSKMISALCGGPRTSPTAPEVAESPAPPTPDDSSWRWESLFADVMNGDFQCSTPTAVSPSGNIKEVKRNLFSSQQAPVIVEGSKDPHELLIYDELSSSVPDIGIGTTSEPANLEVVAVMDVSGVLTLTSEPTIAEGVAADREFLNFLNLNDTNADDPDDPSCPEAVTANSTSPSIPSKKKKRQPPRKNVKKRVEDESGWLVTKAKIALNSGQEHVTPKGKHRPSRSLRSPCQENCKRCGTPRLTDEERQSIHKSFWKLGKHERQWDFISRCVKVSTPVKKLSIPGSKGSKSCSRVYFLHVGKKARKVCKIMFLSTLGICDSWVDSSLSHSRSIDGTTSMTPDKRGKHHNRPQRTLPETMQSVRDHINLFPRVFSHYCRSKTKKEYLELGVSIERMYKEYVTWATANNIRKPASPFRYRRIFNTEFNLGVYTPRKDQCLKCNRWKFALPEEKVQLKPSFVEHLKNKNACKKLKESDKEAAQKEPTLVVSTYDLQKVLPCPYSETSVFFYLQKLSIYNFTIFDMGMKRGYCYVWDETQASRGANEVCSNVLSYIINKVEEGSKDFIFYSDSPTGQNKNRFVFSMYLYAAMKYHVSIKHRFLEPGHTYMEVDSMHARIEAESKMKHLFEPSEWIDLIKCAKLNGDPYIVKEQRHTDFFTFKPLVGMQNWDMGTNNEKIVWTKVREVFADSKVPNVLSVRYNFDGDEILLNVSKKKGRPVNLENYVPERAYSQHLPLKPNKRKDLEKYTKPGPVPTKYHNFWRELLSQSPSGGEDASSGNENEDDISQ